MAWLGEGYGPDAFLFYSILHSVTYAGYHPLETPSPEPTHNLAPSAFSGPKALLGQMQSISFKLPRRQRSLVAGQEIDAMKCWHMQASLLHLREDKRERHWGRTGDEICKRALAHPRSVASSRRAELLSQNGDLTLALRQGLAPADGGSTGRELLQKMKVSRSVAHCVCQTLRSAVVKCSDFSGAPLQTSSAVYWICSARASGQPR